MANTALKLWIVTLVAGIMLATGTAVHAQDKVPWTHPGPLLPDSSNFVTASLLVASPGEAMYSSYGHCALRMESPINNLDYCFSFEMDFDESFVDYIKFFAANVQSHIIAVPTSEYLGQYRKEGRGVRQYELNLTTHEKQELWRTLDNDYVDVQFRKYNLLENNCSSILFATLLNAPIDRTIEFSTFPEQFNNKSGVRIRYYTQLSPWAEFLDMTFLGTESDTNCDLVYRISPEAFGPVIKAMSLVDNDGNKAPMLVSEKELLTKKLEVTPTTWSPLLIFSIFFVIVAILTIFEWFGKSKRVNRVMDVILLVLQTIAGIIILYTSFVSGLFGKHWNWYLIPFNPLPLIIWLLWHKRKEFYKVYLLYAAVLVLFIIATPLSEQLDLPHQLITATLAVRCCYNYYDGKRNAAAAAITTKRKKNKNKKHKK